MESSLAATAGASGAAPPGPAGDASGGVADGENGAAVSMDVDVAAGAAVAEAPRAQPPVAADPGAGAPVVADAPSPPGAVGAPMEVESPVASQDGALEAAMASCADSVGTPTSALGGGAKKKAVFSAAAAAAATGGAGEEEEAETDCALVDLGGRAAHVLEAPLVEPDVVEMRLLQHVDAGGRLVDTRASGEKFHALLSQARLRDADASSKAVFLVVLRRSSTGERPRKLALRTFLDSNGLAALAPWLEEAQKAQDEALVVLCVRTLADLPVTGKFVKGSSVGKSVKRIKKEREERLRKAQEGLPEEARAAALKKVLADDAVYGACDLLMKRWLAKVNESEAVAADEEAELEALDLARRTEAAKRAAAKPKLAKKRAHNPNDLLASALTKRARTDSLASALDGSRAERIQARRAGRGVAGVKEVVVETEQDPGMFGGLGDDVMGGDAEGAFAAPATPTSRSIDASVAESLIAHATGRKIKWADDEGKDLTAYKEPEEGWLESLYDDDDASNAEDWSHLSLEDRKKKEHERERANVERARLEAAQEAEKEQALFLEKLRAMRAARPWKRPTPSVVPKECIPEVDYVATSGDAMATKLKRIMEARYLHPRDIPHSPDETDLARAGATTTRTSETVVIPAAETEGDALTPDDDDVANPVAVTHADPQRKPPPEKPDNHHYQPPPPPNANASGGGLPDAITRLDEDTLRYLLANQQLYDSLFVNRVLDERRLEDIVAQVRRRKRR